MDIREVLAINLKRLRVERGLSQEELAHRASIDRTYVSLIERRKYATSVDKLQQLADALEINPADLLMVPDD